MSRRSTILQPGSLDGTSQRDRALPALDPGYVAIDERSTADLLAFVQAFAEKLRYFAADEASGEPGEAGTWADFARHPEVSIADMVAYIADPERFAGERARWLGRPHFALLLTFVELLGHARAQLGELTRRHLEYYYRDVLRMEPAPARPDRAAMVFRLASQVAELRLPAGTALQAGRDSSGVARIYRTERDLFINRAQVAALRSVFVHRRITEIPDVREDRDLTAREAFEGTLRIALGAPRPGDPVPPWQGQAIDTDLVAGLQAPLAFAAEHLYLPHHELRALMQRVRRRDAADAEWNEINRLMGVPDPADPRDFVANLESRVGVLDFDADGLPQVAGVDDLYEHRHEAAVRAYINDELAEIGYDAFVALMAIKLRIDAEWAEINRLLEQAGRRLRGLPSWSLAPADPTAFADNLAQALAGAWPPPWPSGTGDIYEYEALIRQLEAHFCMTAERLVRMAYFAQQLGQSSEAEAFDWSEIDRILIDAHREQVYAGRRTRLAEERGARHDLAGFDAVVGFALGKPGEPMPWTEARPILEQYLDKGQLDALEHFRQQLVDPAVAQRLGWPDVYRVLELAQRYVEGMPEPVARKIEWRNLYAYADATAQRSDAEAAPGWKTFGDPPRGADPLHPPTPGLGWALRSPVLALSQGTRTLTLTLGFAPQSFDLPSFVGELTGGLTPAELDEPGLRDALDGALVVEASTAKGWIELDIDEARLAPSASGNDYWELCGMEGPPGEDRPALQLVLTADVTRDPIAAPPGASEPALRLLLRPRWDPQAGEWITLLAPFEPLELAAVHLRVDVDGLSELQLQQDDRALDPRQPFEPFGSVPAVGSRLYLGHPELVRGRLDALRFDVEWMGLPASLARHYHNYPEITGGSSFEARIALVDRNLELTLASAPLFDDEAGGTTRPDRSLTIASVPAALASASPGFVYTRRLELEPGGDLRAASRYFCWELAPRAFGHAIYPALAAGKARELSIAIARASDTGPDPEDYRVDAPYTPMIKRLRVRYQTSIEVEPAAPAGADRLLHVHPFGESAIDPAAPGLLPRYDRAGELYIGLRDLDASPGSPRQLALLLQLAEGTSDPEAAPAPVSWSYLDGDRWQDLGDGNLLYDSTRGLINSGIVELALPDAAPGSLLPGELYWLRVAIASDPTSVCDTVDIRAQAVSVRFEDRGNAADHYRQPLPVGKIDRLVEPDARIAAIEQPFTSFGGKPPERPESFYTRVSERLRHKQRALTPWDYERLVLQRFARIHKARCLSASAAGDPGHVDVIVIPDIRDALPSDAFAPRAPANLLADIQAYLSERAPATASVWVRNARYVPVLVRLGVRFLPGVDQGFARKQLQHDLVRFLSPWAHDAGAEPMIGGKIYASSIVDFVDRRDYVDYVAEIKLFRGRGQGAFELIPPQADYHVATERPDEVLVAARQHHIDVISELGYQQASFTGLEHMKIELDFIVG